LYLLIEFSYCFKIKKTIYYSKKKVIFEKSNDLKKLERSLTLTATIAISIAGMLGSGIFVLPGLAAAKTGSSVWLAYLLAAVCILPAALSKSELATAMPSSGGTYVFIERTFGPAFGTIAGIGLWISLLLKSSFALVGFGAYLAVLIDVPLGYNKIIAIFFLGLILLLNIFGVKKVGKVQLAVVIFSLIGLILVFLYGLSNLNPLLLNPFLSHGSYGLISTVAFVYISYAGVTKIAAIAGEIKNPSKNLPLAMLFSLLITTIVYVSVTFTLVGNIPMNILKTDIKPIYTIANLLGGKYIGYAAAVLGVVTLISMANSGVLASSRFPFAMARDKLLPSYMTKLHSKYLTPVVTIVLTCILMAFAILFLNVEKIAKLASAFMVLMFIVVNASVIILRETSVQWYNPAYRSPFYPYIQLVGIISGIILLIFLGLIPLLAIFMIIVIGILIYLKYGKNASRTGVLRRYGHRPAMYLLYKRKNRSNKSFKSFGDSLVSINANLVSKAGVVVPLLGNEKSAEMLVEIGAALNTKDKLQTVNITEVPDQTFLDAFLEENASISSLRRRINLLAETRNIDIDIEAIVTHNVSGTIHSLSNQTSCDWLVMGWYGRAHNGILVRNPIGWLLTHINSNFALFKDNGVRHFSKILLASRLGKKERKLIETTDRICQFYNASFTILHIVPESTLNKNIKLIHSNSMNQLKNTICTSDVQIVKSNNSIEAISQVSSGYDLLIIGTPEKDNWISVMFGAGKDKFAEKAACSVLRLTFKKKN